ncbi:MAG: S46 family peptidase [Alphaproteobacteria bacterium]
MKHLSLAAAFVLFISTPALAEEGMWTFENFPTAKVQADLGWAPDQAWLDHARLSSARIEGGCSAAIVSAEGLVQTNHHCVIGCVQNLSTTGNDLVTTGYLAKGRAEEKPCPGMALQVLTDIADVTGDIAKATAGASGAAFSKARDAVEAQLERACKQGRADRVCEMVALYEGGQYKLYGYKRYEDIRLVFAPEIATAFFGGDPDNFNFPRYCLDVGYLRLYENGKPAATPNHFKLRTTSLQSDEPVFISGNPGGTSRDLTAAQLAFQRDHVLPFRLDLHAEIRGRLLTYMAMGEEEQRIASDTLFGQENSFKARLGRRLALIDPAVFAAKQAQEADLLKRIAADPKLKADVGDAFGEIAKAIAAYEDFYQTYYFAEQAPGYGSELIGFARKLVRGAAERAKPDNERLPGYTEASIGSTEASVLAATPIEKPLETILISFWLSKTREYLTADDPFVHKVLGKESPEGLAARLVVTTKLGDPAERARLWKGGEKAIAVSTDPLIVFMRGWDDDARAVRKRYEQEVDGPIALAHQRLARARFAVYGDKLYPDATFTLRLSYGRVKGWTEPSGRVVEPFTFFSGLGARATNAPPFKLAPSWAKAYASLAPGTIFDVSTTNDIIGGNSGSPLIDRDGLVAGAAFDGNIHSLGGDYIYDGALNRTVSIASTAILEALAKVYGADALVTELRQ